MRSAFLGTPESAVPILHALTSVSDVTHVITRPDRRRGRAKAPQPCAVRLAAESKGLVVSTPVDRAELGQVLADLEIDVAVVAAFGMIIPSALLDVPRKGMINVHFSLLPVWRGAAPIERSILAGDSVTGVTLMQMDAGLDTGPILASWASAIGADEPAGALTSRLADAGAELLGRELPAIVAGERQAIPQDPENASYASMLTTSEARIDWTLSAADIIRRVRAFNPKPGAHTQWGETRMKIHVARRVPSSLEPGELEVIENELLIGTGVGGISVSELQPAGARRMDGLAWARGVQGDLGRFE